jgi:hypothetical protein
MGPVTTVTKFLGTEKVVAAQDKDSLYRRLEKMQRETLRSPAELPESLKSKSTTSIHRLSVHIYRFYVPSDQDQPTR